MAPSIGMYRSLIEYHYALYRRLWESVLTLTNEQFLTGDGYSHGSVRDQIIHVAMTDQRWLQGLQELPKSRRFKLEPEDYPTKESARKNWDKTEEAVTEYVSTLNEEQLFYVPKGMRGPVWQVLAHIVNHGTDHRAQILRDLHDFGAPTFDQDLILHLWAR